MVKYPPKTVTAADTPATALAPIFAAVARPFFSFPANLLAFSDELSRS
nr:MAG TPA: hypothetical protein [Caudoviricetes sp.]